MAFVFKVRKGFDFLPPLVWCLILDATDIFSNAVGAALDATGVGLPLGLGFDAVWDVVVTVFSLFIFEGGVGLVGLIELPLPTGLDLLPTYTAAYAYSAWQNASGGG